MVIDHFAETVSSKSAKHYSQCTKCRCGDEDFFHGVFLFKKKPANAGSFFLFVSYVLIQFFCAAFEGEYIIHFEIISNIVSVIVGVFCILQFVFFESKECT